MEDLPCPNPKEEILISPSRAALVEDVPDQIAELFYKMKSLRTEYLDGHKDSRSVPLKRSYAVYCKQHGQSENRTRNYLQHQVEWLGKVEDAASGVASHAIKHKKMLIRSLKQDRP